jgi:hypothetical protein
MSRILDIGEVSKVDNNRIFCMRCGISELGFITTAASYTLGMNENLQYAIFNLSVRFEFFAIFKF